MLDSSQNVYFSYQAKLEVIEEIRLSGFAPHKGLTRHS